MKQVQQGQLQGLGQERASVLCCLWAGESASGAILPDASRQETCARRRMKYQESGEITRIPARKTRTDDPKTLHRLMNAIFASKL